MDRLTTSTVTEEIGPGWGVGSCRVYKSANGRLWQSVWLQKTYDESPSSVCAHCQLAWKFRGVFADSPGPAGARTRQFGGNVGVGAGLLVGVLVAVGGGGVGGLVTVGEGVKVGVGEDVGLGVGLRVGVAVAVRVGVLVGVEVSVGVGVAVCVGVTVGVALGVLVCVAVGVAVRVFVGVAVSVGVTVGVTLGVSLGVAVGVFVGVAVSVGVTVGVMLGVLVGVAVGVSGVTDCARAVPAACSTSSNMAAAHIGARRRRGGAVTSGSPGVCLDADCCGARSCLG
jgi:hypothetical protein